MEIEDAISRAKQNDQKAFNFLVESYWDAVYGFQLKRTENENDAEDGYTGSKQCSNKFKFYQV